MRLQIFAVLLLVSLVLADPDPQNGRRGNFQNAQLQHRQRYMALENNLQNADNNEVEEDDSVEGRHQFSDLGLIYQPQEEEEEIEDPCEDIHCGAGKECHIDMEGKGFCLCVQSCYDERDDRRMVCSNYNETWQSDCALYQMRCLCEEDDGDCPEKKFAHMHIDYYGKCQQAPVCEESEMLDFPRRMREWLYNIMRDMADRQELNERANQMQKEAEADVTDTTRWSNAAIWKWCSLDGSPHDRSVSRHELFPLRAPLYTLEHCIAPFLDGCDADDDNMVTLSEWTKCLQLSQEHLEDMETLCDEIAEAKN